MGPMSPNCPTSLLPHKFKVFIMRATTFVQYSDKFLLRFTLSALEERFVKRCKAITERVSEETNEIEGEWLTLGDMQKMEFSELLDVK